MNKCIYNAIYTYINALIISILSDTRSEILIFLFRRRIVELLRKNLILLQFHKCLNQLHSEFWW